MFFFPFFAEPLLWRIPTSYRSIKLKKKGAAQNRHCPWSTWFNTIYQITLQKEYWKLHVICSCLSPFISRHCYNDGNSCVHMIITSDYKISCRQDM